MWTNTEVACKRVLTISLSDQSRLSRALCIVMYTLGRSAPSENSHLDENSGLGGNSHPFKNCESDENSELPKIAGWMKIGGQ